MLVIVRHNRIYWNFRRHFFLSIFISILKFKKKQKLESEEMIEIVSPSGWKPYKRASKFCFFSRLISELSSDIFLNEIGNLPTTSIMDFRAIFRWCGILSVAIFRSKRRWLSCTIQFTRTKWTIYIGIRRSSHLLNTIFKSNTTWKRWSMWLLLLSSLIH